MPDLKDVYLNVGGRRKDVWIGSSSRERGSIMLSMDQTSGFAKTLIDTTANWNNLHPTFVPSRGQIVVYSDKGTVVMDGQEINVPGIKIGDGLAYLIDLPFVGADDRDQILVAIDQMMTALLEHTENHMVHVTQEDKRFWDNKLNYQVDGEILVLNRD